MSTLVDIPLDSIETGERTRQEYRNLDSLARSITEHGLLSPVNVRNVGDGRKVLVCGGRRLAAVRSLGWAEVPALIADDDMDELAALLAEGEENTEREPFTPAEAVRHRQRIRKVEARQAKERQREGQERGREARYADDLDSSNLDESKPPPKATATATRHRTAKATGYGATTLDKAEEIVTAAQSPETPELVRQVAALAAEALEQPGAKVDREHRALTVARTAHQHIETYPELAHYSDQPKKVTDLGRALDAITPTEREHRRENLRKSIAAEQRRQAQPAPTPAVDYYAKADAIFVLANRLAQVITTEGGAATIAAAVADADPLITETWREQFTSLSATLTDLATATHPVLRSIK